MNYTRSGKSHSDKKEAVYTCLFLIFVFSAFFVAAGGVQYLFPEVEDPEQSQLYRLYVVLTHETENFTLNFQLDVTVFNESVISDRFRLLGYNGSTYAKATGNLLWSLNSIDSTVIEVQTITPTDFSFHWYGEIHSEDVQELAPSEPNKWHWLFIYGRYYIDVQLGPRFSQGDELGI